MKKESKNQRRLPARKLMLSYLIVIMAMSLIFSSVFYITSLHELDKRPIADLKNTQLQDPDHELDEWIGRRSDDGRINLGIHLITLNLSALVIGGALSYWLARRTLRPIEKSLNEQDQFIADASHELRTPITSALLSNEVALKNSKLTLAGAKSTIEGNIKDMQELKRLSDELLSESGEGQKNVRISEVDIQKIVNDAIDTIAAISHTHATVIHNQVTAHITKTDAERLRKILVILLENAIKYSPPSSTVIVSSKQVKSGVEVTVKDHGMGIHKTDLESIFDRFYRADHSRSKTVGYGLGLSIAKKLVGEIGGTITASSTINVGSEFTVKLPYSPRP
ncbi:MAG: putative Histidine kinase [Candidatus Saccharibacteria bacterium]|nr:putative Histidine kinase [Candidatus Saccharibacteria bacterium]